MSRVVWIAWIFAIASMVWGGLSGTDLAERLVWTRLADAPPSPIWAVTTGITAGTYAGKWIMVAVVAPMISPRRLAALLILDGAAEVGLWTAAGAPSGAWLTLPMLFVAGLALGQRSTAAPSAETHPGSSWPLQATCAWMLVIGATVILWFHGLPFDLYRDLLVGLDPDPSWTLVRLAYARIALGFSIHYGALWLALRRVGPTDPLMRGAAVAQVAWVVVDSVACIAHGALFNVVMINMPAMLVFCWGWWLTWRRR